MKTAKSFQTLGLLALTIFLISCNKPKLFSSNQASEEITHSYSVSPEEAFRAAKTALAFRGYALKEEDPQKMTLETYWQPTTADSHYVLVFGRKDYGTVGAYYKLVVKVTSRGSGSQVAITNVAKSFISNVKSSAREEDRVLEKVDDFTRRKDIDVTNIGLQ